MFFSKNLNSMPSLCMCIRILEALKKMAVSDSPSKSDDTLSTRTAREGRITPKEVSPIRKPKKATPTPKTAPAKTVKSEISPLKSFKEATSTKTTKSVSPAPTQEDASPIKPSASIDNLKTSKEPSTGKAANGAASSIRTAAKHEVPLATKSRRCSPIRTILSSVSDTQQISEREEITIADQLISKLLVACTPGKQLTKCVEKDEIMQLCAKAKEIFLAQPPLLEANDVVFNHAGSDLLRLFDKGGFPPSCNYLFLGDYVDRGKQNLETISLLLCYKVKYPDNFFLLRGNHECSMINRVYGFYDECHRRYQSFRLWQMFQDVFNVMPFCALIDEKILCMHGGLSPRLKSLDQIRQIRRPVDPPNPSMLIDLLWSDPNQKGSGWQPSPRGLSYTFGADVVAEACQKLDIDMIVRAHQVVQDGYELFANRKLVTLFSAPHYCGQFNNAAAMMFVDETLTCSFQVLRPQPPPQPMSTSPLSSKANSKEEIRK